MVKATSPDGIRVPLVMAVLALALLGPHGLEGQDPVPPAQEPADTVLAPLQAVQPDIYVADLSVFDGLHYLGGLRNVTRRTYSYDNQPMFTPDSRSLLYTTEYNDGDRVQTEIHRYYLSSRRETRITRTDESEYSPTPVPGDRAFSAIRVEADSAQRVWRFTMEGMDAEVLFRDLDAVGYQAWGNETTMLLYVLGDPATVRIADLTTGQAEVVAQNVGRSLNKIPNRNAWSFVEMGPPGQAWINEINIGTREVRRIISTVGGGEFHAWTPSGMLLMASDSRIYQWDPEVLLEPEVDPEPGVDVDPQFDVEPQVDSAPRVVEDWRLIADLEDLGVTISRIVVSPDGSKIAIVGDPIPDSGR